MMKKKDAGTGKPVQVTKEPILYISCGIPGSGKTTFLKNHIANGEVIVSRDDIRFSLLKEGEDYFSHEDQVFNIFIEKIAKGLNSGHNVYADATHLNRASRAKLLRALYMKNENFVKNVQAIFFNVPVATCIQRNENRKGTESYVPVPTIRKMANKIEMINKDLEHITHCYMIDESKNALNVLKVF